MIIYEHQEHLDLTQEQISRAAQLCLEMKKTHDQLEELKIAVQKSEDARNLARCELLKFFEDHLTTDEPVAIKINDKVFFIEFYEEEIPVIMRITSLLEPSAKTPNQITTDDPTDGQNAA